MDDFDSRGLRVIRPEPEDSSSRSSRVCVMGLGYIGLPTAAVLADSGHHVTGVDVQADVVETVNRGQVHIVEPGLPELVAQVVQDGRLQARSSPTAADVYILCVPTPITASKEPDLSYLRQASQAIAAVVERGSLIILESTSPPGTTLEVVAATAIPEGLVVGEDVFVAHCPERVIPGRVLHEVRSNDRVVGGLTPACTAKAEDFYATFVEGCILTTRAIVAELTKLMENAYRDVNIAFANELSVIADRFGADPMEIIEIANRHPRVNILKPGPGVGGHCISVDPWFLVHHAPSETQLIKTARKVNDAKPDYVVEQVTSLMARTGAKAVGCLGLAYKADVDDFRESPSLQIVRRLQKESSAELYVCEPFIQGDSFAELTLHDLDTVLEKSELLVLLTDHTIFHAISRERLADKEVIDTRGIWRNLDPRVIVNRAARERHDAGRKSKNNGQSLNVKGRRSKTRMVG